MKNIFLLIYLLFSSNSLLFSQRIIEVNYEVDKQGNYNFYCRNNGFCNYILEVNFNMLENTRVDHALPYREMVKPGSNKLFKLSKEKADSPFQFKYTVNYTKGCINPVVDTNFTYILPIAPGKESQVYIMENSQQANTGDGSAAQEIRPKSKNWYVIRMRMKPGDTIYSARRGTVTEVDDRSGLNDSGVASAGTENYIDISHADCSFGHYGVLRKNSALVKAGQFVEAGTPIGLVGGDKYGRGSEARFSVYYNIESEDSKNAGGNNRNVYWEYVPLKLWTKNNGKVSLKHGANYISEHPSTILKQEIKKPEVKKVKPKKKV